VRPLPHRAHREFVETEGWTRKGRSKAKTKTGGHFQYTLLLPTGLKLNTRISHGRGQIDDPGMIAAIYRDQLQVSEQAFWDCVDHGLLPNRQSAVIVEPHIVELDPTLMRNLVRRVGLSEVEVGRLSKEQAVARWHEYLSPAARDPA